MSQKLGRLLLTTIVVVSSLLSQYFERGIMESFFSNSTPVALAQFGGSAIQGQCSDGIDNDFDGFIDCG